MGNLKNQIEDSGLEMGFDPNIFKHKTSLFLVGIDGSLISLAVAFLLTVIQGLGTFHFQGCHHLSLLVVCF